MATVILKGQCVRTTALFRCSLRNVSQCDTPTNIVATMPRTISATPYRIAFSCSRTDSGVADLSRRVRKKPTVPKPKVAKVSVVRIQARVVRSSASWVRNLARELLSLATSAFVPPVVSWFVFYSFPATRHAREGRRSEADPSRHLSAGYAQPAHRSGGPFFAASVSSPVYFPSDSIRLHLHAQSSWSLDLRSSRPLTAPLRRPPSPCLCGPRV